MPFKTMLTGIFLTCSLLAYSQNGGVNWTFGRGCGLHFEPNGMVTQFPSSVLSREGVATASDPVTGNLLFYSDGEQIWDATNNLMLNGSGLLGQYSSTQSAVIVPKPGDSLRYYIFTAAQLNSSTGYRYSIVDMTGNNGLGIVESATKNTLLLQNGTEKIGLSRHCNGRDFWLILREGGSNNFWVYLVNENGVQAPQKFPLGIYLDQDTWNEVGYMRVSSNEQWLVHPIGPNLSGINSAVELFHFDNTTGAISGPIVTLNNFGFAYGAEFSADSKLLYLSDISGLSGVPSAVYQYDLSSGNAQTITNSKIQLIAATDYQYGALQLAPNGKIYVAKEHGYDIGSSFLDVIESPSVAGTGCNYQLNGLTLTQGTTLIGLPHADYRPYQPPPFEVVVSLCKNESFLIDGVAYSAPDTITDYSSAISVCDIPTRYTLLEIPPYQVFTDLYFCPGSSIMLNGIPYSQPAVVTDTLLSTTSCDTLVTYNIQVSAMTADFLTFSGPDTLLCPGDQLVINSLYEHTVWNEGILSPMFEVSEPGLVIAEAQNENGCLLRDSVIIRGCCNQRGLYVPNIFSPNDDGFNDEFCVFPSVFCTEYSLQVYDRWGELLFDTRTPGQCWSGHFRGKLMPPGVYIWTVQMMNNKGQETLRGDVTLIR